MTDLYFQGPISCIINMVRLLVLHNRRIENKTEKGYSGPCNRIGLPNPSHGTEPTNIPKSIMGSAQKHAKPNLKKS